MIFTQLRLDALPTVSANELLLALLGTDATVELLKPVILARAGGNPLFLEESVRTLVETHALSGERGAHRLDRPITKGQAAPTLRLQGRWRRRDRHKAGKLAGGNVSGAALPHRAQCWSFLPLLARPARLRIRRTAWT
jgi:hypothetical protein